MGHVYIPRGRQGHRILPDVFSGNFDPATLSLTGWWRGSYTGSPWVGTASAGASSGRNLTEATNPPSVGAALNGFTPPDFDGVNDILTSATGEDVLYGTTAYTMVTLFRVDTFTIADPGEGTPYNCCQIGGSNSGQGDPTGGVAGTGAAGVFRFGHYNGTVWHSASGAIATNAWTMAMARYNGTNIEVGINGGATSSQAQTTVNGQGAALKIGPKFSGGAFLDGKVMELMTFNGYQGDLVIANIKAYLNLRYGLAL